MGSEMCIRDSDMHHIVVRPGPGMPRVSTLSTVSHMPSCRTCRFDRVGFQSPCRARRVVSQRRVSHVSHVSCVSCVSCHGKPSGINPMQKQSGRTWHAPSRQIVVSAVTAVSAVSGQNAVSAESCQPCLVHALVHRVVFWQEVRFRPMSCRTAAFLQATNDFAA